MEKYIGMYYKDRVKVEREIASKTPEEAQKMFLKIAKEEGLTFITSAHIEDYMRILNIKI